MAPLEEAAVTNIGPNEAQEPVLQRELSTLQDGRVQSPIPSPIPRATSTILQTQQEGHHPPQLQAAPTPIVPTVPTAPNPSPSRLNNTQLASIINPGNLSPILNSDTDLPYDENHMAAAIQAAKETLANPASSANDGGTAGTTNNLVTTTTTTQPLASPNSSTNPSTTSTNLSTTGGRKKATAGARISPGCRVYAKKKYLYNLLKHDCQRQPLEKLHNNYRLFGTVISGNTTLGWGISFQTTRKL